MIVREGQIFNAFTIDCLTLSPCHACERLKSCCELYYEWNDETKKLLSILLRPKRSEFLAKVKKEHTNTRVIRISNKVCLSKMCVNTITSMKHTAK